jgi:beta-lactam-binding protein with PASTA domain
VTLITALLVGIGLGAASATDQQALDDANAKADKAQLQLNAQRAEVRRLRVKADGLQTKADSTAEALQTTNTALKRATAKAEVPRFVGSDAADATDDQTVTQLHWKLRSNTQATDAASPGTVLSQIPKPGTVLKGGKTITLVVARRPPPKPKQWVTIKTFSGGSSTKTPEFHIPSGVKARLTYTMPQDSNNAITIYRAPSEYVDLLLNEIGPQHGSTRLYQPGTFYLDVDGAYTIDVQVFKRPS